MTLRRAFLLAPLALLGLTALILHLMGRIPICECGTVELWYGDPSGPGNSQHLSDWYSFSHLIHGFIFFALLWPLRRRLSMIQRLTLALVVECAWEIIENTDWIINRYRDSTVSLDYHGDSILNSMSDCLFMVAGFLIAARLPAWATIALALALEVWAGVEIRDNLTLNILMLLWPLQAVRDWQAGV
ncbi:DUF2585 family protein [Consotaella salsifontis]|uniref:Uncharacterized protein n=1 Tax=Consotaella salsifontis TaxID=1365950 RepID=A0A1T4QTJ3_9HYPH|nr:DUF2585 family protein [Consotaella salsifontis]SKA07123.1 Protein of unknown function [Consotaella salsifontis]